MDQTQTKSLRLRLKPLLPYLSLPLILLVSIFLWLNLQEEQLMIVYSDTGTWDLRDFDFGNTTATPRGRVEHIPGSFLTPDEFVAREAEAYMVYPHVTNEPSTVRVRFLLPCNGYYVISRISTGYLDRIYVNGDWLRDVGEPDDELHSTRFMFTARPIDGVIEIVHSQSNFIYYVHGIYQPGIINQYTLGNASLRATYTENIVLGIMLSMAMVSLLLFLLLHNYRPALYFALLCLVWFAFTGITGSQVFITIAPWLTDPLRLRIATIVAPLTGILAVAIIRDLFPNVLHKYFLRGVTILVAAWVVFFLLADTGLVMGYFLWPSMAVAAVCGVYIVVSFLMKVRKPDIAQFMYIMGVVILMYAAIRDILVYVHFNLGGFYLHLPPFAGTDLARIGVIAFLLCQAAAIFIVTMREMEAAKANEQKSEMVRQQLATENAALDSLSRMKTEYLANIAHEIKTPLTVVSCNIQRAAIIFDDLNIKDETLKRTLSVAQEEIMRMARLGESALRMAAMQEIREKMKPLDAAELFRASTEAYRSLIEKQGNILVISTEENLPQIYGNADQLIQVLTNLLTNANKHTTDGEITVRIESEKTENDSQFVSVSVQDTGAGLSAEILPRIFERGFTGSDGTGMGLAISKDIIKSHGGEIEISSKPGGGTTAFFKIPVYKPQIIEGSLTLFICWYKTKTGFSLLNISMKMSGGSL